MYLNLYKDACKRHTWRATQTACISHDMHGTKPPLPGKNQAQSQCDLDAGERQGRTPAPADPKFSMSILLHVWNACELYPTCLMENAYIMKFKRSNVNMNIHIKLIITYKTHMTTIHMHEVYEIHGIRPNHMYMYVHTYFLFVFTPYSYIES